MKCKFLTSCALLYCGMFFPHGAYASGLSISSSDVLPVTGPYSNVEIHYGGNYNLSALDNILTDGANLTFNRWHGALAIGLNADDDFDGDLEASVKVQTLVQLKLTDEYLATHTNSDKILRLRGLVRNGTIEIIEGDSPSSTYSYEWVSCAGGDGMCLKRVYSQRYTQARAAEQEQIRIVTMGVQNNPRMLLRPMSMINNTELVSMYDFSDELFLSIAPEYYTGPDFGGLGLRLNSGMGVMGKLSVGVSGYVYRGDFENSVSGFKSDIYGGNVRLHYTFDENLFLRGVGGFSFANIKCDDVVDGGGVVSNPHAFGVYGGADFGAKFNFESGLMLSPFVGVGVTDETIVDVTQNDFFVRVGNDVGFKYFMDGVSYNYFLRTGINSNGYLDASIGIGVWTVADKIGGGVSVGAMDTESGWTAKVSGNIRFAF
ncbi:MAG: autotransporter domain-containing protein [Alphaproteobacteria bacterium]